MSLSSCGNEHLLESNKILFPLSLGILTFQGSHSTIQLNSGVFLGVQAEHTLKATLK